MGIEIKKEQFVIDGKPGFLNSGEMHYFRLKRDQWPVFLKKMKDAGLNTVSTYLPWSWHEYEEGKFDFTGSTVPERDIEGFIEEVKAAGLYLTLKPGPVIMAEFLDQGIPDWFIDSHEEVLAKNEAGNIINNRYITLMHPVYLKYVKKWYDKIMPLIKNAQVGRGGPVGLLQVCNEVGIHQWLSGQGDYSEVSIEYFRDFLKSKYKDIKKLNAAYSSSYKDFDGVEPPAGKVKSRLDFVRWTDYHLYHRAYYNRYLSHLCSEIRNYDIDLTLYHNVPGWVFGRAVEFPVCISTYTDLPEDIILGVDHIPERVTFTNFHDDYIINQMVEALQKRKYPLFGAELQAGTREHNVRTFHNELKLFYKACFADGLKGMNYYMFCQGENPPGRGAYSHLFYWENCLDVDAAESPLYQDCKYLGDWLKENGKMLVESSIDAKIGVVFYPQYYSTEFFYPLFGGEKRLHPSNAELLYDLKYVREKFYFETLLKILRILNIPFEIVIPERSETEDLLKYKKLWVFSLDFMSEPTQKKVLEYINKGGNAVIFPMVPYLGENLEKCTVLQDGLGITQKVAKGYKIPRMDVAGLPGINVEGAVVELSSRKDCRVTAVITGTDKCCGLEVGCGSGKASVLGAFFGYQTSEHLDVVRKLCEDEKGLMKVSSSDPDLITVLRENGKEKVLFLLNYSPLDISSDLKVMSGSEEYGMGTVNIKAHSGIMCPMEKDIKNGVSIRFATAELTGVKKENSGMLICFSCEGNTNPVVELDLPGDCEVSCPVKSEISVEKDSAKVKITEPVESFNIKIMRGGWK